MENFSAEKFLSTFFRILYDGQAEVIIRKKGEEDDRKDKGAAAAD